MLLLKDLFDFDQLKKSDDHFFKMPFEKCQQKRVLKSHLQNQ